MGIRNIEALFPDSGIVHSLRHMDKHQSDYVRFDMQATNVDSKVTCEFCKEQMKNEPGPGPASTKRPK